MSNERYAIPSVTRALRVLETISEHKEGLTLSELGSVLDYPENSLYRISATLIHEGYLTRDKHSKKYRLTGKTLSVGYQALNDYNIVELALPHLKTLRDKTEETVILSNFDGKNATALAQFVSHYPFKFTIDIGSNINFFSDAGGKAILTQLPEHEAKSLVEDMEFHKLTQNTITTPKKLLTAIGKYQKLGYSVDLQEHFDGIHCVGAAILDHNNYPIGSITVTGPSARISETKIAKYGKTTRKTADQISALLGAKLVA